jgi:hypothetical protein
MNGARAWSVALGCVAGLVVPLAGAATALAADPAATPDSCITVNGGDWNACNVGNSGRGDLPYRPVPPVPHTVQSCIELNQGDAIACRVGSVAGQYPG